MLHCRGPTTAPFAFRQQQAQSLTCTDARGNRRGCLRPAVATGRAEAAGAEAAREQLLWRMAGLQRGSAASQWDRALVAEAQVELEAFGGELDFERLPGLWRLLYTTAEDVRPLAGLNRLPFSPLHVGDIYQRFSGPDAGTVQNVIEFSVPSLLSTRPAVSGTFVVDARYTVSSSRRIALTFSSANLRGLDVDSLVLAPAVLPRSWLQHQALLALQQLDVGVPLTTIRDGRGAPVGQYQLTLVAGAAADGLDDILIGRASQGTFIFQRSPDTQRGLPKAPNSIYTDQVAATAY